MLCLLRPVTSAIRYFDAGECLGAGRGGCLGGLFHRRPRWRFAESRANDTRPTSVFLTWRSDGQRPDRLKFTAKA